MVIKHKKNLCGVYTALVTPFLDDRVDFDSLGNLVDYQISSGVNGLVVLGTTGESVTIEDSERTEILKYIIKRSNGRVPVIVGTGSSCTAKAIKYTIEAEKLGADGSLVVAPYYNKPNQSGLYLHYSKIAEAVKMPIILYSIPSRCGIEIDVETIKLLRNSHKNIVGIKEAGGSCNRVSQIVKELDDDFVILSGDDALTLPFMALGANGVISVASNWICKQLSEMLQEALNNNLEHASSINRKYYVFFRTMFIEPNPVPIKQILFKAGIIKSPQVRLPLCQLSSEHLSVVNDLFDSIS